jgi:TonB family protein
MENKQIFRNDQLKSIGLSLVCCVLVVFILGCINMRTDKKHPDSERTLVLREGSDSFQDEKESPSANTQERSLHPASREQTFHTPVSAASSEPQIAYANSHQLLINQQKNLTVTTGPLSDTSRMKQAPASEVLSGAVLSHRKLTVPATIPGTEQEEGVVAVQITVDADGRVTEARAVSKGSTITKRALWSKAQEAALQARFDKSPEGNQEQHGIYYFRFAFL